MSRQGIDISFLDALFTSTSAVCVTGLTVVDTGKDFSRVGQVVIVLLIQTGGLGVMTFAGLAFQLFGMRMSLRSEAVLHDTLFQRHVGAEFGHTFRTILLLTGFIEGVGAVLLFVLLSREMGVSDAAFSAIFHSISAFCNAGFSLRSDNLVGLRENEFILIVIMTLIVLGGLGYTVVHEIYEFLGRFAVRSGETFSIQAFSFHARIVVVITLFLIFGGAGFLILFGIGEPELSTWELIVNALFQSVTARTAGFNSVDIGRLPSPSLLILIMLMFVGGAPGSCAGGIKITSAAILWARFLSGLRGQREVNLRDRMIPQDLISRTDFLVALALLWNLTGIFFLFSFETGLKVDTLSLIFEQISAFGTVGLSTGITPQMSWASKLWLIATMFVGRLGPLTIALWIIPSGGVKIRYPRGTVMIG
ncbi:MAG: trk/ktr system potassium uptake protein [Thermodesulfobacteriota bacterium]|nr:trk/ktr system potassium uptake protein [Thermodesulfobacteriota bacterium]